MNNVMLHALELPHAGGWREAEDLLSDHSTASSHVSRPVKTVLRFSGDISDETGHRGSGRWWGLTPTERQCTVCGHGDNTTTSNLEPLTICSGRVPSILTGGPPGHILSQGSFPNQPDSQARFPLHLQWSRSCILASQLKFYHTI